MGRTWSGARNKKGGLKESGLFKVEFHLAVTYHREILPQSRGATRSVARPINNVSAGPRNFGRAMKQRVCTRGNGAARSNLLRCKSDRMNRDGKQKLASSSRPQFRDIARKAARAVAGIPGESVLKLA